MNRSNRRHPRELILVFNASTELSEKRSIGVWKMSVQNSTYKQDGLKCFGNWVQVALLGSGGFGAVALWKHRLTNEQIAIKIFKDVKNKERSLQEIELTKRLNHENVIRVVPVPDDWKKLSSSILCMEYCAEGNLRKLLSKPENSSGLPENTVRRCLKNVKDGLEYIHSQNIIHRDIKPENVVLQKLNDEIVFKLIDFGYGIKCDKNSLENLRTLAGTSDYVAPEVFIASDGYTISVDYWGFGFICFEIITGYRPFLPHLKATEWIAKVRHKTEDVICVYSLPYKSQGDNIVFSDDLPAENHITKVLASKLKLWLRLALKMDYRKRGYNKQNELIIFSFMEEILNKKVITIFSSVVCELLSYEIDDSTTLITIKRSISQDTSHSVGNQVFLSPSGEIVSDDANVIEYWDPSAEIAMLYLLTNEGVPLPFKEPIPPQSIVNLVEQGKEPSSYHCRKKVYSDSIYFFQTQLKLCKAFYKTIFVELLSVREFLLSLTALEQNLRHNLVQCSAKLHLVQSSIQYNEKCYANACESKVIIESRDFLGEKKQKIQFLKSELKQTENKLKIFTGELQDVTKNLDETCVFDYGDNNIEMLNKCLDNACCIYKNLQQMPKELRQSEGNCSDMVNIMFKFLETKHSIINDKRCYDIVEKSKYCKATVSSMFPIVQKLTCDLKNLDADIVRVELGLFKAIWSLKKPSPPSNEAEKGASSYIRRTLEPTSYISVGLLSSPSDEISQSTTSLINTNHSLHRQFEDSVTRFQENFEDIKKRYDELGTELQAT